MSGLPFLQLIFFSMKWTKIGGNKLGLNWAKLSSNWNWALLQSRSVALNWSTKLEKVVLEYSLISNYRVNKYPMPGCSLSSSTTPHPCYARKSLSCAICTIFCKSGYTLYKCAAGSLILHNCWYHFAHLPQLREHKSCFIWIIILLNRHNKISE